jgi:Ni/Co efflux regulator RcnB
MECNVKRPLSLLLAAALVAGTMAVSIAPAAAENFGVTVGVGNWNNDRWHDDDNGNWRHHRHHRHNDTVIVPGFSLNLGVPYEEPRAYYHHRRHHNDCWRNDYNELVCR